MTIFLCVHEIKRETEKNRKQVRFNNDISIQLLREITGIRPQHSSQMKSGH